MACMQNAVYFTFMSFLSKAMYITKRYSQYMTVCKYIACYQTL